MSDSDEDDYAFIGTPLDQFDEDAIPRKKPISIEDQVATDKHGRRRFHGAFTGGFSAGFFNSVGSLEGWKPTSFKSSRTDRSNLHQQLPSHFMDDEDTEEFGIAPQVLRTKSEYSSSKRNSNKRERESRNNSGPIPGEPVLKSILKPTKKTMGVLLLMKMGWKPGDEIGEKLEKKANKVKVAANSKSKVYGCARGPEDTTFSQVTAEDSSDSDCENEIYRELGKKAPHFIHKEDMMGLGYKGLDRNALSYGRKTAEPVTIRDQFNKTIKITGQAFGVGAFEEDDDDIYSTDDKSQYDFSLEPLNRVSKKAKNVLPITDGSNVIIGFVKATFKDSIKSYPSPLVPSSFSGIHIEKKSRFDVGPDGQSSAPRRMKLDASLRAAILDTAPLPRTKMKEEKIDSNGQDNKTTEPEKISNSDSNKWKPFSEDPSKQERYDKYLHFIKIGAKDLVRTVLLNTMSDLERDSELREFESAAQLYSGKLMSDRFTHGSTDGNKLLNEDVGKIDMTARRRVTVDWAPHSVVCKRFNIKPPNNATDTTLQSVADSKKRPKFSVFDFLNSSSNLADLIESGEKGNSKNDNFIRDVKCEVVSGSIDEETNPTAPDKLILGNQNSKNRKLTSIIFPDEEDEFKEPENKIDFFKAIFLDSDDESDNNEVQNVLKSNSKNIQEESNLFGETSSGSVNVLRNTSPPRGIFANLDLDKLANRNFDKNKSNNVLELTAPPKNIFELKTKDVETAKINVVEATKTSCAEPEELPDNSYGPSLPKIPADKPKAFVNLKLDVNDDKWVEKSSKDKHHHKSKHHKKKHKKEKKRDKHKKKKKKRRSLDSESDSDSH